MLQGGQKLMTSQVLKEMFIVYKNYPSFDLCSNAK